jgi:hypothetical protein
VGAVKEMVLAPEYRHMPLGTLARYGERIGEIFASASTWAKLVRERGWRRPRQRLHPRKPTVGVRALPPNEILHIDTTVIRLLDGAKVCLRAVLDNHSRKILAWMVTRNVGARCSCAASVGDSLVVTARRPQDGTKTSGGCKTKKDNPNEEIDMKTTKSILMAAAVTGALAALPGVARADVLTPISGPSADRLGCHGMGGQKGDKQSCQGKDQQGKKDKDKNACSGKSGCGGKDKQK